MNVRAAVFVSECYVCVGLSKCMRVVVFARVLVQTCACVLCFCVFAFAHVCLFVHVHVFARVCLFNHWHLLLHLHACCCIVLV